MDTKFLAMTNKPLKKIFYLFIVAVAFSFIYSCKKDPNEGLESPRIFTPNGVNVRTTTSSANVTWTAPLLTTNLKIAYLTEFSQDTTFATSEFSIKTDTTGVTVGDDRIQVRKKYFVRVKALSTNGQPESNWMVSRSFTIVGEQWFEEIRERAGELKETQVTLRWRSSNVLNKITLTKKDGQPVEYQITPADAASSSKLIIGLEPGTDYTAEIFEGSKSKGLRTFKTVSATNFSRILNPGDDVAAAITSAANGDVIGLNPGIYNGSNYNILGKAVSLKSTSGNPANTKVIYKEFILNGTGAGIRFDGIELDGTTGASAYLLNLVSGNGNADPATFGSIIVNNCLVYGANTAFLRANRGAAAGSYKMDQIIITNSTIYEFGSTLGYHFMTLDKLQFNSITLRRSTFNNIGRALIGASTVIAGNVPQVTIDYCTFNNLGAGGHYVLLDAGQNPMRFSMTNSIVANVPRTAGNVNAAAIRATGAGSGAVFSNNNTFNFSSTVGGTTQLTFPSNITVQAANQTIDLGWTSSTTNFRLPANSTLRTASSSGGPIGDPIWTY